MSDSAPTPRQLLLLSKIAVHIAVTIDHLRTGDLAEDLAASTDLIELTKKGLIVFHRGERVVRCTATGRTWVFGYQTSLVGLRLPGGGH